MKFVIIALSSLIIFMLLLILRAIDFPAKSPRSTIAQKFLIADHRAVAIVFRGIAHNPSGLHEMMEETRTLVHLVVKDQKRWEFFLNYNFNKINNGSARTLEDIQRVWYEIADNIEKSGNSRNNVQDLDTNHHIIPGYD